MDDPSGGPVAGAPPRPSDLPERGLAVGVGSVIAIALIVSLVLLPVPYSYWMDELFSVSAATGTTDELRAIVVADVHPPLYLPLLKIWVGLFGDAEPATRSMSWICYVAALAVLFRAQARFGTVAALASTVFMATNRLALYYSNETRSYGLSLLLATIVATTCPVAGEAPRGVFLGACLLLALTHYFGLLIAGVFLSVALVHAPRSPAVRALLVATGAACLAWPCFQVAFGDIMKHTGGNFWIRVDGPIDTLLIATSWCLPGRWGAFGPPLLAAIHGACWWAVDYSRGPLASGEVRDVGRRLAVLLPVIPILVVVVALLDLWSPMSTARNYTVTVPVASVLVGGLFQVAWESRVRWRGVLAAGLIAYGLACTYGAWVLLEAKTRFQDWRAAARTLVEHAPGRHLYHAARQRDVWRIAATNHYVRKFSGGLLETRQWVPGEGPPRTPALVLVGHNFATLDPSIGELERMGAERIAERGTPRDVRRGDTGVFRVDASTAAAAPVPGGR